MKEKLIIRNFGPIKDIELDLGRFNILIGEQATGKSTVAKVLAVCRYFSYIVAGYGIKKFENGLTAWGLEEAIQKDSFIFYSCEHYSFTAEHIVNTIYEQLDEENTNEHQYPFFLCKLDAKSIPFSKLLGELDKIKPEKQSEFSLNHLSWSIPTSFFLNDVKSVMDNPFYLPTQRGLQSIFSIGQNSIQNLSDALFNQLAKLDGIARRFTNETYIEPLDIYYKNVQGRGYIRKANETEYYSLFNAASGYQSEIPIVLVIKYYNQLRKRSKTFLIEEPEQNLFPTAQEKLMEYIVEQTVGFDNSVLITTQSPYIQTSLNNMMYAYQVSQSHPEQTENVINKKYWLNPEDVSAYRLISDGTAKNIIDNELKQINAGEIDEVSRVINEAWDKLADIEYSKKNED